MSEGSMPLYPFDEPLHAVFFIGFGTVFFGISTAIVYISNNQSLASKLARYDRLFVLINGRPRTSKELSNAIPPFFWSIYRGFGRLGQFVGALVILLGIVGLITALVKKLM